MKKMISFSEELSKQIQEYADKYLNGNFNMAVRYFCSVGVENASK